MQHKISTVLIIVLAILVGYLYAVQCRGTIPRCAEDVVVIGVGQFDAGLWTRYICGPALDDFPVKGE